MEIEEQNFYVTRSQWLDYLVERRDLTHGDFRIAYFIASKINPADGCMWWSVGKIALELSVSIGTVTAATDKLSDRGLLVITKGRKGMNYYYMRMPLDPHGAARANTPIRRQKTGGRKSRVSKTEIG
jgi:DNA-binding transcriptional MocR family regulator